MNLPVQGRHSGAGRSAFGTRRGQASGYALVFIQRLLGDAPPDEVVICENVQRHLRRLRATFP